MTYQMLRIAAAVLRAPCHRRAAVQILPLAALLSASAGCGSGSSGVSLTLVAPEPDQVLSAAEHDSDPDVAGLQFDIEGISKGIDQGTTVNLFIDDEQQAVSGRIGAEGRLSIPDVTLPPGTHRIYLQTSTGSTSSDQNHEYTLRALVIDSPDNGAMLSMDDDERVAEEGVQISVSVTAFAIEPSADITLLLDGDELETETADDDGEVVYSGITLSNGRHTFKAVTGEGADAIESGEVAVEVRQSCAAVSFLEPAPPTGNADSIALGGDSCPDPMSGDEFVTRVVISTDAGNGRPVTLLVNGTAFASATVSGATAVFEDVVLTRFNSSNTIAVDVENSEGVNCIEPFPGDVFVDCQGSDCSITSPTPVSFTDTNSDLSMYLNAAQRGEDGFDIEVESDPELDGQRVQLVIDGNTRRPLTATAQPSGETTTAEFGAVNLPEGEHTIEALCTDAAGNVTSSGERTWIVDTTPCEVSVTDPAEDTLFVPGDDEDNASDGTQIVVSSTVSGNDCVRQRSRICEVAEGITGADFVAFDGTSPLLTTVTLEDAAAEQALCVEIEDRAGNIGLGAVGVSYRATAPSVLIETPNDGDQYNAAGGGGYIADADPSTSPTACDAEFSIACSELGQDVQLRHDSATGDVFATGECEARGSGDPALPAGYAGRAKITALFDDGDQSATIVASQAVAGSSSSELLGVSSAVTLGADCRRPTPSFSGNPCNIPSNQLDLAAAGSRSFGVFESTMDIDELTLTLSRSGGASITPTPGSLSSSTASFTGIDFAFDGEGSVTVQAVVSDDFGNTGQFQCTVQILADVPEILSMTSPVEDAVFGPGDACDTGVSGEFGVLVSATIDQAADREVDVIVNGTTVRDNLPITNTSGMGVIENVCVPVPDNATNGGASTVTVRADSTLGDGFAEESRTVHVVLDAPMDGIVIDALVLGSPTDADFRSGVVATWTQPTEEWPGQLVDYELRCAGTELEMAAATADKDMWWADAEVTGLPDALTPDDANPSVTLAHRPQEPRHCVLRAVDVAGNLTPLVESTDLTMVLRQTVIAAGAADGAMGSKVAAIGDVDGDGIDDVLASGVGSAELIFGTTGDPAVAERVVFTMPTGLLAASVSGLGDFNGDGLDDFAIGNSVANSLAGQVSIFFGRPRAQWPATPTDIETVCNADVCLEGAASSRLGRTAALAGDFDNDGRPDLALGSAGLHQLLIVLGDDYEIRDCTACRASGESCVSGVCTRDVAPGPGVPGFWRLRYSMPTGDSLDPATATDIKGFELVSSGGFGASLAGLGDFDTEPGDDLAIGAPIAREVHFLSGQPYTGSGIESLAVTDLGLPDPVTGTPDNMPISAQDLSSYGFVIANIGDFHTPAGATGAKADLGVARVNVEEMYVVPGDPTAADDPGFNANSIRVAGSGNIGQSIATSVDPAQGLLGDLDGDGEPELCIGTRTATPHDILLWYPDQFAAAISSDTVVRASGISIVTETDGTAELFVQYIGDFNADGHLDIAVGDFRANSSEGRLLLLY